MPTFVQFNQMKKLNIGCNNQTNVVHFLKADYNIVSPYVYIEDGEIVKNFDILLLFDESVDFVRTMQSIDIPTFGIAREHKFEQSIRLQRLGINTPITYKILFDESISARHDAYYSMLEHVGDYAKLILKCEDGARGIGQALVTKDELYNLLDDCANDNVKIDDIIEKYEIGGKSSFANDEEKEYLRASIQNSEFSIQEVLSELVEWRVLYLHGHANIIIKRNIGDSWQANTSIENNFGVRVDDVKSEVPYTVDEIADKLGKELDVPFLSIDFYKDGFNRIGVLEYQMQFGYSALSKTEAVYAIKSATKLYLKDKNLK